MANTTKAQARMDVDLKRNAEAVFNELGINPSEVMRMLYKQVVLHRKIPFEVSLPEAEFNKHVDQALSDHTETLEGLFHR